MAVSKNKKKPTPKKRTNTKKQQNTSGGFQNEIILLVILAGCIILLVSNFGLGGFVGDAISNFTFGAMGLMAYIFPILFFVGCAFFLSNKKNHLAYKKIFAGFILFLCLCGILQLLTEGYARSTSLMDYYSLSADYHTGGGLIGGAICISVTSAFGVVGGYVIIGLVVLVCLIHITQHSFLDFVMGIGNRIYDLVKGGQAHFKEGQPERELKREIRAQQKRQLKEERRAERIRKLEMELAQEEEKESSVPFQTSEGNDLLLDPKKVKVKTTGFLDGTNLMAQAREEEEEKARRVSSEKVSRKTKKERQKEKAEEDLTTVKAKSSGQGVMEFEIHRPEVPAEEDLSEIGEVLTDVTEAFSQTSEIPAQAANAEESLVSPAEPTAVSPSGRKEKASPEIRNLPLLRSRAEL